MIPRRIFSTDVDPSARLLLALLWTWAANDDPRPFVWPSPQLLASYLRCTTRSIRRSLQTLREANLVTPGERSIAWKGGSHTMRGWLLGRADVDAIAEAQGLEGAVVDADTLQRPELDEWADDLVRGADDLDRETDDIVTETRAAVDDLVRGERTISSAPSSLDLSTVSPKGDPAPAAPDDRDLVELILAGMQRACETLRGRKGAGPDDCDANRKMIQRCNKAVRKRGQTDAELLVDWLLVIELQLASVRPHPETWKYLSLSTLSRPVNWLRIRDTVPSGSVRRAKHTPSTDDDV